VSEERRDLAPWMAAMLLLLLSAAIALTSRERTEPYAPAADSSATGSRAADDSQPDPLDCACGS